MRPSPYKFFDIRSKKGWAEVVFSNGLYNYITSEVLREIREVITGICQDNNINCAVLRSGTGGVFSRGLEIKSFNSLREKDKIEFVTEASNVLSKLYEAKIPFICAVHGKCFGTGLELILSCDIRIATYNSRFGAPEVIFGLISAGGGIQRLLRLVGKGQAKLRFGRFTLGMKYPG